MSLLNNICVLSKLSFLFTYTTKICVCLHSFTAFIKNSPLPENGFKELIIAFVCHQQILLHGFMVFSVTAAALHEKFFLKHSVSCCSDTPLYTNKGLLPLPSLSLHYSFSCGALLWSTLQLYKLYKEYKRAETDGTLLAKPEHFYCPWIIWSVTESIWLHVICYT